MNYIYGRNPIHEALKAFREIKNIIISESSHGEVINQILVLAKEQNIPVQVLTQWKFTKLPNALKSQGIFAQVGEQIFVTIDTLLAIAKSKNENPFIIIFDEIEDTHNIGALIRTAVSCGAHGGIIPKHKSAPINETVSKTSAGAIEHFPIAKVTNLANAVELLKEQNIFVACTDMNGEKNFTDLNLKIPVAIVIGNEAHGVRKIVKSNCNAVVKIPMSKQFDSLNASVAGGIVMYEVFRQRNF